MGLLKKIFLGDKAAGDENTNVSKNKTIKTEEPTTKAVDINKIVCPYCFAEFAHYDAHFRVHKNSIQGMPMSDEEIIDKYGDDEDRMEEEMRKAKIARKFQIQERDERLSNFWENRFKIKPEQRDDPDWNYDFITLDDDDMLFKNSAREGNFFSQDDYHFLYEKKDFYGNKATLRLCPHCHNKISTYYGMYPVIYISVVGITGSGKTVYLNQLVKEIDSLLSQAGLSVTSSFNMEVDKIQKGKFLPMSTQTGIMYPPMMINVTNRKKETWTLVFYVSDF